MPISRLLQQYLLGPISQFSSTWQSLPFLLKVLRIPLDAFKLFPSMTVVTRYMSTPLEVLTTLLLAVLLVVLLEKVERLSLFRVLRTLVAFFIGVTVLGGVAYGASHWLKVPRLQQPNQNNLTQVFFSAGELQPGTGKQVFAASSEPYYKASVEKLMSRRILRVGYHADAAPFCYFNKGHLVGYDISLVERLASELGVRIVFYPYQYNQVANDLRKGRFDIAMCGLTITAGRIANTGFTVPLYKTPTALIVKDYRVDRYRHYLTLRGKKGLLIAALQDSANVALAKELFPFARVIKVTSFDDMEKLHDVNALVTDQVSALQWTLLHPYFQTVVPHP